MYSCMKTEKLRPVETIPGMGRGDFNYDIF
jgi:hypothetical protein